MFARFYQGANLQDWRHKEAKQLRNRVARAAPDVLNELFDDRKNSVVWKRGSSGLLQMMSRVQADGPATHAHLLTFAAKLGMAMFREHVGKPLPEGGSVFAKWFLNVGLTQDQLFSFLNMLPEGGTLKQGTFEVTDQFEYQFNSDETSVAAALCRFQEGMHVFSLATDNPEFFGPSLRTLLFEVKMGGLLEVLRQAPPAPP